MLSVRFSGCFGQKCSHCDFDILPLHFLILYVLQQCLLLLCIPWSLSIRWLTDPLAHVQICTLSLYITPTAHFTFTLVNETETMARYTPPHPDSFPPYSLPMVQWPLSHWGMEKRLCSRCYIHIREWWMFQSNWGQWGAGDEVRGWFETIIHKSQAEIDGNPNPQQELESPFGHSAATG